MIARQIIETKHKSMNACFIFREIKVAPCGKSREKKKNLYQGPDGRTYSYIQGIKVSLLANSQYSVRRDMGLSKYPKCPFKMSYLTIHKNSIIFFK